MLGIDCVSLALVGNVGCYGEYGAESWPEQRPFWMPFLHGLAAVVAHPGCVSEFLPLSTKHKMRLIMEDMPVLYREGGY